MQMNTERKRKSFGTCRCRRAWSLTERLSVTVAFNTSANSQPGSQAILKCSTLGFQNKGGTWPGSDLVSGNHRRTNQHHTSPQCLARGYRQIPLVQISTSVCKRQCCFVTSSLDSLWISGCTSTFKSYRRATQVERTSL